MCREFSCFVLVVLLDYFVVNLFTVQAHRTYWEALAPRKRRRTIVVIDCLECRHQYITSDGTMLIRSFIIHPEVNVKRKG